MADGTMKDKTEGEVVVPAAALVREPGCGDRVLVRMPESGAFSGCVFFASEDALKVNLEDGTVKVRVGKKTALWRDTWRAALSPDELRAALEPEAEGDAAEGTRPAGDLRKEGRSGKGDGAEIFVPRGAVVGAPGDGIRLRMPAGEYEGFSCLLPSSFVRETTRGRLAVLIPGGAEIAVKSPAGDGVVIGAERFAALCRDKTDADFVYAKSGASGDFCEKAERLRTCLPAQMTRSRGWVDVRVKRAGDEVFLSSPMYGLPGGPASFEEAVANGTWNGSDALGFSFSGNGLACVCVYGCVGKDGLVTDETAREILASAGDTYAERSASGRDLHIFGLADDFGLSHVSEGGAVETYFSSDFIEITGDAVTASRTLAPFSRDGAMRRALAKILQMREPIPSLTDFDKEAIESAKAAKDSGEAFLALYAGENAGGTEDFCDESLMTRIACRTSGDLGAMMRIFRASGRREKSREHTEHLAGRAMRHTADFGASP